MPETLSKDTSAAQSQRVRFSIDQRYFRVAKNDLGTRCRQKQYSPFSDVANIKIYATLPTIEFKNQRFFTSPHLVLFVHVNLQLKWWVT